VSLRSKLLLAQAPLAVALAAVGVVSATVITRLSQHTALILADNYRSVLAAQRMKESLERTDSAALFILAGHAADAAALISRHRKIFEDELGVQEGNISEPGEERLTAGLREAWDEYRRALDSYQRPEAAPRRSEAYFTRLQPLFLRVKQRADEILAINQDAMARRSDRAAAQARRFEEVMVLVVAAALLIGLSASAWLTARALRPLGVVSAAVRRFGGGDLRARADVSGGDEIAAVAVEFNSMAERLERYRRSSLGELLQAQQAAQAAINGLPDPVLLLDASGKLQGANTAAAHLLGVDTDRPADEGYAGVDPGVRSLVDRLRAHVLGGKGPYVPRGFEEALRVAATPEGERTFLPRAAPLYGESGAVGGAVVILQDVTRLSRFEELRNDLVATVAHELRTPLTSLRMALHLCTEEVAGPLTPKQADLLFAARDDCERLQIIVDDILDLSRLEAGRTDLERRRVQPQAMVELAVEAHRAAAAEARVTLRKEVLPGLPEIFVDPDRLQLVFSNLVANAVRYAPAASEISVRARPERGRPTSGEPAPAEPAEVRFEVSDQGPGIPEPHRAHLFEKFFRVPGALGGGAGLGLFIARWLVQAHGGRIGYESGGGGAGAGTGPGATFWFTVPVAPPTAGG
jgi:signal transduction histidine kinase